MTAFIRHYRRGGVVAVAIVLGFLGQAFIANAQQQTVVVRQPNGTVTTTIQVPAGVTLPPGIVVPEGAILQEGAMPPNAAGAPSTNAAPASPEDLRLQELLKLKFDRTPTSILNALSEPEKSSEANTNEVERFELNVVLGNWATIGELLDELPDDHGQQVYRHLLQELPNSSQPGRQSAVPGQPPRPSGGPQLPTTSTLVIDDLAALIEIAPDDLTKADLALLGRILTTVLSRGDSIDPFIDRLKAGIGNVGGSDPADRQRAAELLVSANRVKESVDFLPDLEAVKEEEDFDSLDLFARQLMSRGMIEKESESLKKAWEINQFILASEKATSTNREPALKRIFELVPLVSDELGSNWLRKSFADEPAEGLAILSAVSRQVQDAAASRNVATRQTSLELQKDVIGIFLQTADRDQSHWKPTLQLMAMNWFQEGDYAKQRHQPPRNYGPQYDPFGNMIGYSQPPNVNRGNQLQPINATAIIKSAPDEAWIEQLDSAFQPALLGLITDLYLKAQKHEEALKYIKRLAASQPETATELANSFLQFWTTSKNPMQGPNNMQTRYVSGGQVYYTSSPANRPQGISLTRAKQQRNIRELADLLDDLYSIGLTNLSDPMLVQAFSGSHSPAEVFREEDIVAVFGAPDAMKLETLSSLLQTMRQRLAGQWRAPRIQQTAQTKRKDPQIEKEVLRGYETVLKLITGGLERDTEDWSLSLVRAQALFDMAEFQYGKQVDLEIYVQKRDDAFATFENAALQYAAKLDEIEEARQSPMVYQQWFNANLGASDLSYVTRQTEPEKQQLDRIRELMLALPKDAAERHLSAFAGSLANIALGLKPELKPRYLRASLEIVGEHEAAEEAREMVRYYDDLLNEIEFIVNVDGDTTVGHNQPFGVFVTLRHTADIEREAGGFARYLQTKRNPYMYNPMANQQRNFTDEFSDQVKEKLVDQFDVKVITFLDEKVQSRGYGRPGWRETPLAFVLLQAKDASADRIPPLHMDLDFMDQRGTVVLPVESSMILIDSRPDSVEPRPLANIEVTQILDERELADGLLTLEIKATALGILPELGDLVRTNLSGFAVEEFSDNGMAVTHIDTEGDVVAPAGERNWLIKLRVPDNASQSLSFQFPEALSNDTKMVYKRYEDADLVVVDNEIALAGIPLNPRPLWQWILMGVIVVAAFTGVGWVARNRSGEVEIEMSLYELPEPVTPFAVIGLLRDMRSDRRLKWNIDQQHELDRTISQLESYYFSKSRNGDADPDLGSIGRRWVGSVSKAG